MFNARKLLLIAGVAGVMFAAGIVGAGVMAASSVGRTPTLSALFTATSTPTPKSNEATTHESGESAARETAENNGTAHLGGPGAGHSNEAATHEATEPAAREATENAGTPPAATSPTTN